MADDTSSDRPADPAPAKREPIINAPLIVVLMSLLLVGLHTAYSFASFSEQQGILYDFALAPERFWAPAGSSRVYPDVFSALLTLVSTALLHNDWMHVILNSLMLLAFGTPVARAFGNTVTGWGLWMIVFLGSVIAGSALYLSMVDEHGIPGVGASGGVCGLMAAAFLLDPWGGKRKLWSREFLGLTVAIVIANALLTIAAPSLLGMYIGWEAHLGGYIAGAILMTVLPAKGYLAARS